MNLDRAANRLGLAVPLVGGVAWTVLVAATLAGRLALSTIELLFLLAPLVIVPLGLDLLRCRAWSDFIIHRIHLRVLRHIAHLAVATQPADARFGSPWSPN